MTTPKPPNPSRPLAAQGERAPRLKFPMRVRRVRLRYAKKKWETVADFIIDRKTLPQAHAKPDGGFWYELRDQKGNLLYARKVANPFNPSLELFEAGGSMSRVQLDREEAFVELLIPDLPEAAEIRIFSDVTPEGEFQKQPVLVRSVPLRDGRDYRKEPKGKGHGRR